MMRWRLLEIALLLVAWSACDREAEPRPQLVVVIDTDAHLLSELAGRSDVSPDSTIDTLRIAVLEPDGRVASERTFGVAEGSSWPLSFGLYGEDDESHTVQLRLTLFRARHGTIVGDRVVPLPETAIDRRVELTLPRAGISYAHVSLAYDCLGRGLDDAGVGQSCLDATRLDGGVPEDGVVYDTTMNPSSLHGTWRGAIEKSCPVQSTLEHVCVPGGFALLGDRGLVGLEPDRQTDPVPLRPVILSPFVIDRQEYTLGRFRALSQRGYQGLAPNTRAQQSVCNWSPGDEDRSRDDQPLVCVRWQAAADICHAEGGRLPSEAQWEFAARGRGRSWRYPWGNDAPTCCAVSLDRWFAGTCGSSGLEPVGSHDGTDCAAGDKTVDGILDMAGSVQEAMSDFFAGYDSACWPPGIAVDPVCEQAVTSDRAMRGGGWTESLEFAALARRAYYGANEQTGFRCVYPVVTQ